MKQLGNLAIICAQRQSLLLEIQGGMVSVYVGSGPDRVVLSTHWDDDAEISRIIHELNFGKYRLDTSDSLAETLNHRDEDMLWDLLLEHRGHHVAIVSYGSPKDPSDVCLECEDCNKVILDADLYTLAARGDR